MGKNTMNTKIFIKFIQQDLLKIILSLFLEQTIHFMVLRSVPNKPIERKLLQYSIVAKDNSL